MIQTISYLKLCICLTCFKFLFLKCYVSTDFDVHRNWLAITINLPLLEWYTDSTSKWTLDYPPLFAYFQLMLSYVAKLLNLDDILALTKDPIRTNTAIAYLRTTVIISDFIYYYGVFKLSNNIGNLLRERSIKNKETDIEKDQALLDTLFKPNLTSSIALFFLLQPGLILVDHVHFQYNGLLSGFLLLSVAHIIDGNYTWGAFWFSILLNFKHIYLYCAPSIGLYMLSSYCLRKSEQNIIVSTFKRTSCLGLIFVTVTTATYAPFTSVLKQIMSRLFPFKRGLTHAYWAPNIWSIYNAMDKILANVYKHKLKVDFNLDTISGVKPVTSTSGLAQEYKHQYLPSIEPNLTFILVSIMTLPIVIKMALSVGKVSPNLFMKSLVVVSFTSFMLGWHVHEKAILLVILPLVPIGVMKPDLRPALMNLTLLGTYSLFPLLFEPTEHVTKLFILIAYYGMISRLNEADKLKFIRRLINYSFIIGIIVIEIYNHLIHKRLTKLSKFEFLPLMLTSTFSATGIVIGYLDIYQNLIFHRD